MMNIDNLKSIIEAWAADEPLVKCVYIFGSRARSDYRDDSDLDVAVELNKPPGDENVLATWFHESDGLIDRLSKRLPYSLDMQLFDGNETPIILHGILSSGIFVYQSDPLHEGEKIWYAYHA